MPQWKHTILKDCSPPTIADFVPLKVSISALVVSKDVFEFPDLSGVLCSSCLQSFKSEILCLVGL
jgi:hypothetical protein